MDWIWAGAGLFGLGGVGFIAAMFFAPQVAAVIGQFVVQFVNSRVGLAVAVGLGCMFAGDVYRAKIDHAQIAEIRQQVKDAAVKWKVAKIERDDSVSSTIDQVVDQATRDINARAAELQRQLDDAKRNPHPRCVLGPDDVGGVRD